MSFHEDSFHQPMYDVGEIEQLIVDLIFYEREHNNSDKNIKLIIANIIDKAYEIADDRE